MNRVLKSHLKECLLDKNFRLVIMMSASLSVIACLQVLIDEYDEILLYCLFISLNFSLIPLMLSLIIDTTILGEKLSGRLEYYIANGVNLKGLIDVYTVTSVVLVVIPIVLYNICVMLIFYKLKPSMVLLLLNSNLTMFFVVLLLFVYIFNKLAVLVTLYLKDPRKIRTYSMFISVFLMNIVALPCGYLINVEYLTTIDDVRMCFCSIILFFTMICFVANTIICKRLNIERIVLSYKYE